MRINKRQCHEYWIAVMVDINTAKYMHGVTSHTRARDQARTHAHIQTHTEHRISVYVIEAVLAHFTMIRTASAIYDICLKDMG